MFNEICMISLLPFENYGFGFNLSVQLWGKKNPKKA